MRSPGEILKSFRLENGYKGEEFGKVLDISQQQVSRIERGDRNISQNILEKLEEILPEQLLSELRQAMEFEKIPDSIKKEIEKLKREVEENKIPYFSDIKASAGVGYFNSEEDAGEYFEVPSNYAKKGNIAINVHGDSMYPEIKDGDTIVIDTHHQNPENNRIMVVNYEGNLFVKKIEFDASSKQVTLTSINNFYPPIRVSHSENLKIIGKVVYSARSYWGDIFPFKNLTYIVKNYIIIV